MDTETILSAIWTLHSANCCSTSSTAAELHEAVRLFNETAIYLGSSFLVSLPPCPRISPGEPDDMMDVAVENVGKCLPMFNHWLNSSQRKKTIKRLREVTSVFGDILFEEKIHRKSWRQIKASLQNIAESSDIEDAQIASEILGKFASII